MVILIFPDIGRKMAVEHMFIHDPARMWPWHERHLREYLAQMLYGHAPTITIHQAEGDVDARRRQGWVARKIRTGDYADVGEFNHETLSLVWADVVVDMASDLQSHDELEIVYVRRFDARIRSLAGKPDTYRTYFEVAYDLPPKRRCRSADEEERYDFDLSHSPPLHGDEIAESLNKGAAYKRKLRP